MPITKTPYEFLVRFNPDGTVRGSHIKFFETVTEAGEILLQREGKALPVESATEVGFPLALVLDAVHQGAIASMNAAVAAEKVAIDAYDASEIQLLKANMRIAELEKAVQPAH